MFYRVRWLYWDQAVRSATALAPALAYSTPAREIPVCTANWPVQARVGGLGYNAGAR